MAKAKTKARSKAKTKSKRQDSNRNKVMQRMGDEHAYIGKLRIALAEEIGRLKGREQVDLVVLRDMMRYLMDYPDTHHHPLEDKIFAKLLEHGGSIRTEVLELLAEHKDMARESQYLYHKLDALIQGKEKLQRNLLRANLSDFLELYGMHVEQEESIAFPAAQELLSAADWREIAGQLNDIDDPVFGGGSVVHFSALRHRIEKSVDVATSSAALSELLGLYAFLGSVGALTEGADELISFNKQQLQDFRRENKAAIKSSDSALETLGELAKVNGRLLGKGMSQQLEIAGRTLRAAYLPVSEGVDAFTALRKKR